MSFDSNYCKQIVNAYLKQSDKSLNTIILSTVCNIEQLGKYICGLANLALYEKTPYAYAFWGIDKTNMKINGTTFIPPAKSKLAAELSIKAVYSILSIEISGNNVVVLEVQRATNTTMQYNGTEYIFYKNELKTLRDYPDIEKRLWLNLDDRDSFEVRPAKNNVSSEDIINLLDCRKLFEMLSIHLPNNSSEIIAKLIELRFVTEKNTGKYTITNLGALLLAKRLDCFETVEYKAVRVIQYEESDITKPAKEQIGRKGYIVGFEGLIHYIMERLPTVESLEGAIRNNKCIYPVLSIRELVANAMIHQDLNENGCPIVSIFPDRIEITNPGRPLISFERFIDHPPCSRNESLAAAMHKVGICEERGSGYDKIISYIEKYNLPAPLITEYERSVKVALFSKKDFNSLTKKEKIAACYAHVSLKYVQNESSNNTSLRERFKLEENERYKVSRVFNDTCEAKLIKVREGTGMKNREYIPYWAKDV